MVEGFEAKVIKDMKTDSRSAFNQLFLSYYSRLCSFAKTIVKRDDLAEEAVSEIFFNLWKSRKTLEIQTSLKSYLFTSVRNQAIALLKEEATSDEYNETDDLRIDHNDPHEIVEYSELIKQTDNAIELLPPKCRQFFILSRFEGMKYKEIAELHNVSEKTVENQLAKALSFLRKKIIEKPEKTFTSR